MTGNSSRHAPLALRVVKPPASLRRALAAVQAMFPERFSDGPDAFPLRFRPGGDPKGKELAIIASDDGALVEYSDNVRALRALGRIMGRAAAGLPPESFKEKASFRSAGVMLDCSRNGIATPAHVEEWLLRSALMGLDTFMLYTEETYEVPGEPFFGYGRGRYSQKELRALDEFAEACGVEIIPCIQTLGHLNQIFRWDAYFSLRDDGGVLLIDDDKTYEFIEKMIAAATKPFRSKQIHIGMDEAHGVGRGRYADLHGPQPRFEIMLRHLKKVRDMCASRGMTSWMWSDMFFRLGSKINDYYDLDAVLPEGLAEQIPADLRLIYWDYYHQDQKFYHDYIKRHRALGGEPVVAMGAWTWDCLWTLHTRAESTMRPCLAACREEGVKDTFLTIWGDGGSENLFLSALPAVQLYAEELYADAPPDVKRLREGFLGCVGGDWDDWTSTERLETPPGIPPSDKILANPSKWLLWEDPLIPTTNAPTVASAIKGWTAYYEEEAKRLAAAAKKGGYAAPLGLAALHAAAVAKKIPIREEAARIVRQGDRAGVDALLKKDIPAARRAIKTLWEAHRDAWMEIRKPEGWEVMDLRYGGLLARLDTLSARLEAWSRDGTPIPELLLKLPPLSPFTKEHWAWRRYEQAALATVIR